MPRGLRQASRIWSVPPRRCGSPRRSLAGTSRSPGARGEQTHGGVGAAAWRGGWGLGGPVADACSAPPVPAAAHRRPVLRLALGGVPKFAGRASPSSLSLQAGWPRARRQGIPKFAGRVTLSTPKLWAGRPPAPRACRQGTPELTGRVSPAPGAHRQGVPELGVAARLPQNSAPHWGGGCGAAQPPKPWAGWPCFPAP